MTGHTEDMHNSFFKSSQVPSNTGGGKGVERAGKALGTFTSTLSAYLLCGRRAAEPHLHLPRIFMFTLNFVCALDLRKIGRAETKSLNRHRSRTDAGLGAAQ